MIDQIVMMEAPDHADVDSDSNTTEIQRFHFHTQLIGTVTHVTASSQATVESYTYDPYGTPTIKDKNGTTVTASAIKNPYLFTARQLDEETGLYYYRARHYSPGLKRFIQRDPLEYIDGENAFVYGQGCPATQSDPTGLFACGRPYESRTMLRQDDLSRFLVAESPRCGSPCQIDIEKRITLVLQLPEGADRPYQPLQPDLDTEAGREMQAKLDAAWGSVSHVQTEVRAEAAKLLNEAPSPRCAKGAPCYCVARSVMGTSTSGFYAMYSRDGRSVTVTFTLRVTLSGVCEYYESMGGMA